MAVPAWVDVALLAVVIVALVSGAIFAVTRMCSGKRDEQVEVTETGLSIRNHWTLLWVLIALTVADTVLCTILLWEYGTTYSNYINQATGFTYGCWSVLHRWYVNRRNRKKKLRADGELNRDLLGMDEGAEEKPPVRAIH